MQPTESCPCGREAGPRRALSFAACCGRYMQEGFDSPAPDAETLMRSRYSAFVLQQADYLRATWHVSTRPATLDFELGARWLGLEVRRHQMTGLDSAEVEFVARYRLGGKATRLHEKSRFVREAALWWYVDGDSI